MDIFRSRFYRSNVTLLSLVGLWPYKKSKSWQLFQYVTCQILVITVMIVQVIRLIEIWGHLDIMIECLTPMIVETSSIIKATNCIVHRQQITKLLEKMETDWSNLRNKKECEILSKYTEEGHKIAVTYTVLLYGSLFLYLLIPLGSRFLDVIVPLNETRPAQYLFHTQYYVDPEEYFICIFLHTYLTTALMMTALISADAMFFCHVMHACGVLAVIGHQLANLTPNSSENNVDVNITSKDDDDRCCQEIKFCINRHNKFIEAVDIIESSYSMSYFLVFGISVVLLSISAVQLLINFGQVGEVIRLIQLNVAQFNHLFFNSWPCQKLIDQSLKFRESIYAAEWYSLSEKNKHLLRFTMMRSLEPQKITAGKLFVLSMENFSAAIQTSMSYFTVFASIR